MNRVLTATVVVVASVVLLAGCSAGGSGDFASSSDSEMSAPGIAEGGMPDTGVDGSTGSAASVQPQQMITTGSMSVTVDDPVDAASRAASITTGAEGRVDSRSVRPETDGQAANANLVLRIPASQYEAVVDQIGGLGDLEDYTTDSADVTQQKKDLDARITALQKSTARLEQLMAQATTTADLIEIENALSGRQTELDSLAAQRDYLADQIAYSTLSVYFVAPGVIAPGAPNTFWDGFLAGWGGVVAFLSGTFVVIGVLLPWLVVLGAIAGIVFGIIWLARRRRHPQAPVVE
ncbi:MAG: DUF4349 domain-containing protein [Leifsonia sp.]